MGPSRGRSAKHGAARLASQLLKATRRAAKQLNRSGDDDSEALHRFRIRVRKLRAFLRTYRKLLGVKAVNKPCDRLGRLMDSTNSSRDLQVQLQWLERARSRRRLQPRAREAARWMTKHLASHSQGPDVVDLKRLNKGLKKSARQLEHGLAPLVSGRGDAWEHEQAFLRVAGDHILKTTDKLAALLSSIRSPTDHEPLHRARLTVKRVRYILEPMRKSADGVTEVTAELTRLQDLLGDLRDRQVLETRIVQCLGAEADAWASTLIEQARDNRDAADQSLDHDAHLRCLGLRDLIHELHHEQEVLHRRLERHWLRDRGEACLASARAIGEALSAR